MKTLILSNDLLISWKLGKETVEKLNERNSIIKHYRYTSHYNNFKELTNSEKN
jgi:hypothetical protein